MSLLTDIEAKPASPNRILLNPSDDGWRGTIYTPNEQITVEAPTFREAVVAAISTERALTRSQPTKPTDGMPVATLVAPVWGESCNRAARRPDSSHNGPGR
jgi:hypothetical protein